MAAKKDYGHLPFNRQPGPQTRRAYGVLRSGIFLKAFGVLFWIGALVLYFLGMTCGIGEDCLPLVMLGLAGGSLLIGALFYWIGWFMDKRKRKRNAPHLQLTLPRDQFYLGETISPQLMITNLARVEGDVRVGLVCTCFYDYEYETYTQHGTTSSRQTTSSPAYEEWKTAERTPEQTLTFTIPSNAPYSHEGSAVSFAWKVMAREHRRGRDHFTDLPFWVETWA